MAVKRKLKEEHIQIMEMIADNMPKELTDNLMITEPAYPTLVDLVNKGLEDPDLSDEKKSKLQSVKDSGALEEMVEVTDPKIEKKIDEYWETEINKQIKLGYLPPLPKLKEKYDKRRTKTKSNREHKK
jgi:hypothetical protein